MFHVTKFIKEFMLNTVKDIANGAKKVSGKKERKGEKSQLKYGLGKGLDKKKINGVKIIFTVWLPLPATL